MRKLTSIILAIILVLCAGAEAESFRALCAGVYSYSDGRIRMGGYNSVRGVYDALTYNLPDMPITMLIDPTGPELMNAVKTELDAAKDGETVIFYINSHGGGRGTLTWLEMYDSGRITPKELKTALDEAPGKVILIIDCCMSGGFTGSGEYTDEFSNGLLREFGFNASGAVNPFSSSKYLTLVSSSFDQNSYRIAAASADEQSMSTVFSRSLCEALGWDLIHDRPTTLKADMDSDSMVSFTEMCAYVRQRCMYYLSFSSPARQTVQFMPRTSAMILADRSERRSK